MTRKISDTLKKTLAETLIAIGKNDPQRVFLRLLSSSLAEHTLTYGDLLREGRGWCAHFERRGVSPGDVIILILPHGSELVFAYVGCLLYGAVPSIFAGPSNRMSAEVYHHTLGELLKICQTRWVITDSQMADHIQKHCMPNNPVHIMTDPDLLQDSDPDTLFSVPVKRRKEDTAILQHSSGTTGLKKGVALSHEAVLNQLRTYADAITLTDEDTIVSWLPLYHDMGLIACFIMPLMTRTPLILMSPFDWVARPVMLFEAITRYRGTLCWLPNFSYPFMAKNITDPQLKDIDLSSMRAFINCAEPILADSHERFLLRFNAVGLNEKALATCYAMAENTFAVTQGGIHEPLRELKVHAQWFSRTRVARPVHDSTDAATKTLVSSGKVLANCQVRVLSEAGTPCEAGVEGEILIKSDCMLSGYYHQPQLTESAFIDGWYRTGDLGLLFDHELFVTGRKKDMIIVAGINIYPSDVEAIVSEIPGVHAGRVVALGVASPESGTETLVVIAETSLAEPTEKAELRAEIARRVKAELGSAIGDAFLVPERWLVKSSSGKIARSANKERYLKEAVHGTTQNERSPKRRSGTR